MVRCRTELDENTMRALVNNHVSHSIEIKRKKNLFYFLGLILVVMSVYTSYSNWRTYYGTESILSILAMPLIYVVLSVAVFITAQKGMEYRLYKELKKFFDNANIKYIDYVISENGIRININGNATSYKWDEIDDMSSDDNYYYFSSKGKYNVIAKSGISAKNIEVMEELIKNVNK